MDHQLNPKGEKCSLSLSYSRVWKMFSYNNLDRGPLSSSCSYSSFYRPGWWYIKKLSSFIFIIVKNFICCVLPKKRRKIVHFFSAQCISLALKELSLHEWRNDNSGRKTFIICGIAELCLYLLPSHSWICIYVFTMERLSIVELCKKFIQK